MPTIPKGALAGPRQSLPTWADFQARWSGGCGAEICARASRIVLAKGNIPCDVLMVGEAPGESENVLGRPFEGPAGQRLDQIVRDSVGRFCVCPHEDCTDAPFVPNHRLGEMTCCPSCGRQQSSHPLKVAYTNLVCCIPREDDGGKAAEPDDNSVMSCQPRLAEFIRLCDGPRQDRIKLIVCVGALARDWLDPGYKNALKLHRRIRMVDIKHPAAILRMNVAQQGLEIQRCIVTLTNAVEEIWDG